MTKKEVAAVNDFLPAHLQGRTDIVNNTQAGVEISLKMPKVSIKGSKFKLINGDEDPIVIKTGVLPFIILGVAPDHPNLKVRTYYSGPWDPDSNLPPDCSSFNGVHPNEWTENPQSPTCAQCPHNKWGSAVGRNGKTKAKACKESKFIFGVYAPDGMDGILYSLQIPVMSLTNFSDYTKELINMGNVPYQSVITNIEFTDDDEYPRLTFSFGDWLNESDFNIANTLAGKADWNDTGMFTSNADGMIKLAAPVKPRELPAHLTTVEGTATEAPEAVPQQPVDTSAVNEALNDW